MKPQRLFLLSTLLAVTSQFAHAQGTSATTDPVGYISYSVNANSDQKLGLPMQQATTFNGTASNVSGTTVNATGLTPVSAASFLLVTSGPAVGKWEQIMTSSNGSLTIEAAIGGFAANHTFEIKPFWTLGSMFPNGGAIPKSSDVFDPIAEVLMNNPGAVGANIAPSSAYFYFVGDADYPAGWYDSSNPDGGLKITCCYPQTHFSRSETRQPVNSRSVWLEQCRLIESRWTFLVVLAVRKTTSSTICFQPM